ncbi:chromosome transmission fidelity protein 8 [Kluyveromyces marxianus]|uniref:Chromosome transmission fidelity protein 8 n=2 Tax=Kluyveromyces marxianus TaxID=4911 RepID=W0TA72_KLUMD|nr:chromosome transmission fidelity protein 8 [Kluyveromyces marxianus DMKU3-1042]QGN16261.1 chromosome transmission fidelity protein 8 [Kluyveromyces marxianus]BAO40532.1 chromosome transmission fidelity protein 8 [Kluyveromyces marxianus DMKU3-1042]
MPSVDISINKLIDIFSKDADASTTINTPLGHVMIEIQGDLLYPSKRIDPENDVDCRFIRQDGEDMVRFGILSYDLQTRKATLFIGSKQRMLGQIVKIDPPLGVLKFDKEDGTVSLRDVIRYKILFKDRPLPIM